MPFNQQPSMRAAHDQPSSIEVCFQVAGPQGERCHAFLGGTGFKRCLTKHTPSTSGQASSMAKVKETIHRSRDRCRHVRGQGTGAGIEEVKGLAQALRRYVGAGAAQHCNSEPIAQWTTEVHQAQPEKVAMQDGWLGLQAHGSYVSMMHPSGGYSSSRGGVGEPSDELPSGFVARTQDDGNNCATNREDDRPHLLYNYTPLPSGQTLM
eukprot:892696-Pelagomonas_calceolata.AAC.12